MYNRPKVGFRNKDHPLYSTWKNIKQRCTNKNKSDYKYYGAKGITICTEWSDFKVFVKDMGERPLNHSIDRIDSNGNYCKENCRWATPREQSLNRDYVRNAKGYKECNKGVFQAVWRDIRGNKKTQAFPSAEEAHQCYLENRLVA